MILNADRILTGERYTKIEGQAVLIRDGLIDAIGPLKELQKTYPKEKVISYPGCTIMPGMIDLHVHLGAARDESYYHKPYTTSLCALYAAGRMRDTLAAGVTTVRDASSAEGLGVAIKRAATDGYIISPRIFTCLNGICMTGGHGSGEGFGIVDADGVDEIRKAVRTNYKNGADCIKILTSEGYRGLELTQEELDAAVSEAHRLGMKAAAHAGYGNSIEMAIKAGFDSIEHGTHLTVKQAQRMKENNQTWVPTVFVFQYVYENAIAATSGMSTKYSNSSTIKYLKSCVEMYRRNLRSLYDTGVRVATGTDTDCTPYPGASPVAVECACLVERGLSPMEAIECATKNGADYLGMGDCLGQIKTQYIADVIIIEGDPSQDIHCLENICAVYQSGRQVI